MVFDGISKKKSKTQLKERLAISDPGSDDSWALLYQAEKAQGQTGSQEKPIPQTVSIDFPAADKQAPSNVLEKPKVQAARGTKSRKSVAFTSTPFVSHKKVPAFDFSSIVSPIDEPSEGDSATTLILNRNNPLKASDDTFNQLLNPRAGVPKETAAVHGTRLLKSVNNQGDTTRQYAGGIVRGRSVANVANFSRSNVENSWLTTEDGTCSSDTKKTSSSSSKASKKSQPIATTIIKPPSTDSQEGEKSKTNNWKITKRLDLYCDDQNSAHGNEETQKTEAAENVINLNEKKQLADDALAEVVGDKKITRVKKLIGGLSAKSKDKACENRRFSKSDCAHINHVNNTGKLVGKAHHCEDVSVKPTAVSTVAISKALTIEDVPPLNKCCAKKGNASSEEEVSEASVKKCANVETVEVSQSEKVIEGKPSESKTDLNRGNESFVKRNNSSIKRKSELVPNLCPSEKVSGHQEQEKSAAVRCGTINKEKETCMKRDVRNKDMRPKDNNANPTELRDKTPADSGVTRVDFHQHTQNANPTVQEEYIDYCQRSNFAVKIGNFCYQQSSLIAFSLGHNQTKLAGKNEAEKALLIEVCKTSEHQKKNSTEKQLEPCKKSSDSSKVQQRIGQSKPRNQEEGITSNSPQDGYVNKKSDLSQQPSKRMQTASKDVSNQLDKINDLESSSEEEKSLLRDQSRKLRENRHNALRAQNQSKILDDAVLGSCFQGGGSRRSISGVADGRLTSPAKSFKQQVGTCEGKDTLETIVGRESPRNMQSTQHHRLNSSGKLPVSDWSASSEEDNVLLSRNPKDHCKTSDNDVQFEIVSSSEEECRSKRLKLGHKAKVADEALHHKKRIQSEKKQISEQSLKGRNLSFKMKQVRRRKELKIKELLSKGESSDNDSDSVQSRGGKQVFNVRLSKDATANVKYSKANKEKSVKQQINCQSSSFNQEDSQILPQPEAKQTNGRPHEDDSYEVEKDVGELNVLHLSSDLDELGSKEEKEQPVRTQNIKRPLQSQKVRPSRCMPTEEKSKNVAGDVKSKKVMSPLILTNNGLPNTQSRKVKSHVGARGSKKRNSVSVEDPNPVHDDDVNESEPRRSRRKRQAPSMYWLGPKHNRDINFEEAFDESLVPSSTQSTRLKKQYSTAHGESKKLKLYSRSTHENKAFRGSKSGKHVPKPKASLDQDSKDEPVLFSKEYNLMMEGESDNHPCVAQEVRETKCVWVCGMRGDLLALGKEATFHKAISSSFNEAYYVLEGEVSYQFGEVEKKLTAGSFFIVPKGEPYSIKNQGSSTAKFIVVRCEV